MFFCYILQFFEILGKIIDKKLSYKYTIKNENEKIRKKYL